MSAHGMAEPAVIEAHVQLVLLWFFKTQSSVVPSKVQPGLVSPNGARLNSLSTPGVPPPFGPCNLPAGSPSALATAADIPTTSPIKTNHMDSRHVRMSRSSHSYATPGNASVTPNLPISVMCIKSFVFSVGTLCQKLAYEIGVKGFAYVWH